MELISIKTAPNKEYCYIMTVEEVIYKKFLLLFKRKNKIKYQIYGASTEWYYYPQMQKCGQFTTEQSSRLFYKAIDEGKVK